MKLCYVKYVGSESDGYQCYEFIFTKNIEDIYIEDEEHNPSCLSDYIGISDLSNVKVYKLKTKIKFMLGQNNCCYSFMYVKAGIITLCIEDISSYDSYPDDGRLVFHFGESFEEVDRKLAMKNMLLN